MLYIVAKYHCMEFQGNLGNQIWGNDKKASFGPDFGPFGSFGPNLGLKIVFRQFYLYEMLGIVVSCHCI